MKKTFYLIILSLLLTSLVFSQTTKIGGKATVGKDGGKTTVGKTGSGGSGLTANLVAEYKLSDLSDATGRGNTLTNNNSAVFNTGKIGNGAYFTAASQQYLSISNNTDIQMGDIDMSFVLWVWNNDTSDRIIFGKDSDTGREYYLAIVGGAFQFDVFRGGSAISVEDAPDGGFVANAWNLIICWHNATTDTINIKVNARTIVSQATGGSLDAATATQLRIGARAFPSFEGYFDGRIDAMLIYKRILTSQELIDLYNSGTGIEP